MSFGYPFVAAMLLPAAALLGWLLRRHARWRTRQIENFGNSGLLGRASVLPPEQVHTLRQVARSTAVIMLLLALARPQFGESPASMAQTGRDVLVLLDLSRSMNAADANRSRLSEAKAVVLELLARAPGSRFGLIVFGGSAFLQLPLTADHSAFQRYLDAATTDDLMNPSTDLSRALAAAAVTYEHEGERGFQTVVLVSDGESVAGDVGPPLERLRRAGIPVFAIGMGSARGAPIPADSAATPERWHRDHIGRVVQSRLEEGDLRRAALETRGSYLRWSPASGAQLAAELASMEKKTIASRTSPERADRFQWPIGLALLALAADPMIAARRRKQTLASDERR